MGKCMGAMRKTLTVRLPAALYDAVRRLAARRKTSLNAAVEQALVQAARSARQAELYEAFSEVSADADVEFAWEAQRRIVRPARQRHGDRPRRSTR